ncbi:MAG: hypothetical protein ACLFMN_06880 [Desulfobacterales bacterium]
MRTPIAAPRRKTFIARDIKPGEEVYLCQVSENVSCGACCGLYNVADPSRRGICRLLERRSREFAAVPREIDAVSGFGEREAGRLAKAGRPMAEFHHCPYVGFIGENKARVGCMLHPMADGNRGVDFRGLSHYGSLTCSIYFCPTHSLISSDFKDIIRTVIDDWYLFGLIVQETELLRAFYDEIVRRCRRGFPGPDSAFDPEGRTLWGKLFNLKLKWPFASSSRIPARYFFNDNLYPRSKVDYSSTDRESSRYDLIFRELDSVFASEAELLCAERVLDEIFESIAEHTGT